MKCEVCERREATTLITMIVNGRKTVHQVCPYCVRRMQRGDSYATQMAVIHTLEEPEREIFCPACGTSWSDVRRHGRVGCAHCYQSFDEQLEPVLIRMGGAPQHQEAAHAEPADDREQKLVQLREAMFSAVNAEEYERAAQLRDEIRQLEQEGGEALE